MSESCKSVIIPNWLMQALVRWAESAYRRGFQQGLHTAETRGLGYADAKVSAWRSAKIEMSAADGAPDRRTPAITIMSRHTEIDSPALAKHRDIHVRRLSDREWEIGVD
jgi:hypothetical protein